MTASAPVSNVPYFGRAWRITVTAVDSNGDPSGETIDVSNSDWGTEALRVSFRAESRYLNTQGAFFCDVAIYNANSRTQDLLLRQGSLVTISAGYQKGWDPAGQVVWQGRVMQPTWEREGVIDFVIRLHCMTGQLELMQTFVSFAQGPLATQLDIVRAMAAQAQGISSLPIANLDTDALSQTKLPRSKVVHGRPSDYIASIAEATGTASWFSGDGINIRSLQPSDNNVPAKLVYGPPFPNNATQTPNNAAQYTPTLLGTPRQTQEGVEFSVLMDSRPRIGDVAELDLTAIKLQTVQIGTLPGYVPADGRYIVIGIDHEGDTYGPTWETRLNCVSLNFWSPWVGLKH